MICCGCHLGVLKKSIESLEQKFYAYANAEGVTKGELMPCKEQCLGKYTNGVTIVCRKKKRIHPKGGPIGSIEVGIGSNQ
jgi:hypothetical protein